jgi:hypothetical protein
MRVLYDGMRAMPHAVWSELAGPFQMQSQAEAYLDNPPPDLGPIGTVSIECRWFDGSFRSYVLEEGRAA